MHYNLQFVHCTCQLLFFIWPACSKHALFCNFRLHFWKSAPRPRQEPHFWRSTHWNLHQKYHFLDPLTEGKEPFSSFCSMQSLLCPLASFFFSLHGCIFRPQEPNWRHNLMHHSLQLMRCTCRLLFFICPACSKHPLCCNFRLHSRKSAPALGRKHIFEDQPIGVCIKHITFSTP